jgi:hypothetical protein
LWQEDDQAASLEASEGQQQWSEKRTWRNDPTLCWQENLRQFLGARRLDEHEQRKWVLQWLGKGSGWTDKELQKGGKSAADPKMMMMTMTPLEVLVNPWIHLATAANIDPRGPFSHMCPPHAESNHKLHIALGMVLHVWVSSGDPCSLRDCCRLTGPAGRAGGLLQADPKRVPASGRFRSSHSCAPRNDAKIALLPVCTPR